MELKERFVRDPRKAGSFLMTVALYGMFYYKCVIKTTDRLTVTGVFFLPYIFLLGLSIIFRPQLWTRYKDFSSRPVGDKIAFVAIAIIGIGLGIVVEIPVFAHRH